MRTINLCVIFCLPILLLNIAFATPRQQTQQHVLLSPNDLVWHSAFPFMPPGAQIAILTGDPSQISFLTMRFKLPPFYRIAPHWHHADEHVTVLAGSIGFGEGNNFDIHQLKNMTVGSYIIMPAKHHHFAYAGPAGAIIQLQAIAPWDIIYIHPQDDPRNWRQKKFQH